MQVVDKFDRSKIPPSKPFNHANVPTIWKAELSNGVKIIGHHNTELPVVTLSVSVPGGHYSLTDNIGKMGLARLFVFLMNDNTEHYSIEEMTTALQKLGSSLTVEMGSDHFVFKLYALKKNLDKTLALLEERLFHPRFKEQSFKRFQNQMIENLKQQKSNPDALATTVLLTRLFGSKNILSMRALGTESTIRSLTLEDVTDYYNRYLSSHETYVSVVGDITKELLVSKLGFLRKLPNKSISSSIPIVQEYPVSEKTIYIVDVPNAPQTQFRIGYASGLKYDVSGPFYMAQLANYSLGEGESRLHLNIREDKGWTYNIGSRFASDKKRNWFQIASSIRADATDSALVEIMKELQNYWENGISQVELGAMKNALIQRDALSYETLGQKADFINQVLLNNYPLDYKLTQSQILASLTLQKVNEIIKQTLNPQKMFIVLVGDKKKIEAGITNLHYKIVELDTEGEIMVQANH